jgi:hypothetical protein
MINLENKKVRLTKVDDTKFNGQHPNGINTGSERVGMAFGNLEVDNAFYMATERGMFHTSRVTKINDDMTFNTLNSVYKVEVLEDIDDGE